jgi:curved DNA-binding protein CbpA
MADGVKVPADVLLTAKGLIDGGQVHDGLAQLLMASADSSGGQDCNDYFERTLGKLAEDKYLALGLQSDCEPKDVKKAYRKFVLKYHPDKNSHTTRIFHVIQGAYELLNDPKRREEYNSAYNSMPKTSFKSSTPARPQRKKPDPRARAPAAKPPPSAASSGGSRGGPPPPRQGRGSQKERGKAPLPKQKPRSKPQPQWPGKGGKGGKSGGGGKGGGKGGAGKEGSKEGRKASWEDFDNDWDSEEQQAERAARKVDIDRNKRKRTRHKPPGPPMPTARQSKYVPGAAPSIPGTVY